jgi:hypothetical protein
MIQRKFILGLAIITSAGLMFTGCKKDKNETAETIVSAEDNSTAENEFTSLFDVADDFSSNDRRVRAGSTILPSGAVLNFTDSSFTDGDGVECSIDFGPLKSSAPKGMLCNDGRYRAGVIHISVSKRYFLDSAEVTITAADADKFYAGSDGMNMTQVSGTMKLTRLTQSSIRIDVIDAGILGDQFEITGEASGVNRNGESFTVKIDVPLLKKVELGCARTFVKGKITLTNVSSGKTIAIDYDPYSNQACDLTAKATINGKEYFYLVR